jgi:hypothetical protein
MAIGFWVIARYLHMLHRLQNSIGYSYIASCTSYTALYYAKMGYHPKRHRKCSFAYAKTLFLSRSNKLQRLVNRHISLLQLCSLIRRHLA